MTPEKKATLTIGILSFVALITGVTAWNKAVAISSQIRREAAKSDPEEIQRAVEEGISRALARERTRTLPSAPCAD